MRKIRLGPAHASALLVTLITLTALSLMAAYTFVRVMPRIRMAYQNAAWQEARVAAEAGVDVAMSDLLANASGFTGGSWSGWKEDPIPPATPGQPPLQSLLTGVLTQPISTVTGLLGTLLGQTPAPGNSVISTAPIYLDNLRVSAASGVASEVDIRLWGLHSAAAPHTQWFRIRATATCALPPRAFEVPANLDALLRRFSLRTLRPSQQRENAGQPSTIPLPNISRTVEALVEPIMPFELGLWTGSSIDLSSTGLWNVDSFDSSDDEKSSSGLYPGRGSALVQSNGSIACGSARPFSSLYGPLIAANGTQIRGAVATNGGDDPATSAHENVTGALGIDPARIRDDFSREMPPVTRPTVLVALPPPLLSLPFVAGLSSDPAIYKVPGNLTQLRINAPVSGVDGTVVIMIDGDLDLAGPLIVPPAVTAVLYVRGNITFRDSVNSGPWNSNRASQLLIFGDSPNPTHQSVQAIGDLSVTAAFYGPLADVVIDGGVNWIGSLVGSSFRVKTGGDGGLHYDEALRTLGPPVSFRISRYIEDVRE